MLTEKQLKEIEERSGKSGWDDIHGYEAVKLHQDHEALLEEVRRLRGLVEAGERWATAAIEITKKLESAEDALIEERARVVYSSHLFMDNYRKTAYEMLHQIGIKSVDNPYWKEAIERARAELQSEGRIPK